jgi:hypothetical protein
MINVDFDASTWAFINRLAAVTATYDEHMGSPLAEDIAKVAEEYFKPMLNVRGQHTGALAASIQHTVTSRSNGWDLDYFGNFYGLYMDEGNFDPSVTLDASTFGMKAFPVDKRFGTPNFQSTIHGMGSLTPGVPTHYSEKTVEYLAEDKAADLALKRMEEFLSQVVI